MNQHLWMILGDRFKKVTLFDYFDFKQFIHNGIKIMVGDGASMTGEMYGCICDEETDEYIVILDEKLTKNASLEEISFFLYHEIGHAVNKHRFDNKEDGFDYTQRGEYAQVGGIFTVEKEADDYAVSQIGAELCLKGLLALPKRMADEFGVIFKEGDSTLIEAHLRIMEIIKKEKDKGIDIWKSKVV
jgi:hypothetical protein